jgi:signal peptidase I
VAVAGGTVRINGVPLPRVPAGTGFDGSAPGFSTVLLFRERGPEGTSWTVADQRGGGPLGIMAETLVPAGHLFMLGDNRANAMDSRMREVGMIPIAAVQGPAYRRITTRRDAPLLLAPPAAE